MTDIRNLPEVEDRVETGVVQFGDDWPGVFIRGDNALHYAENLRRVIQIAAIEGIYRDAMSMAYANDLCALLMKCNVKKEAAK